MYRHTAMAMMTAGLLVPACFAGTQAIGVAMSEGSITVNDARTPGNATIMDGSTLQTQNSVSQVRLKDGAQLRLDTGSRAQLFGDHVEIQQGSARISDYAAKANGLSVRTDNGSSANVTLKGEVVEVAALNGSVHVFNSTGLNVANLATGHSLDLRPQEGGPNSPSSLTGCAVKSGNDFVLTDETSNVVAQLRGDKIATGERIQVVGSLVPNATPVSPATQVINVTEVRTVGGSCATEVAGTAAGASTAAGGATGGVGFGKGATIGLATLGAAGAGVAAAIATGAINGSSISPSK